VKLDKILAGWFRGDITDKKNQGVEGLVETVGRSILTLGSTAKKGLQKNNLNKKRVKENGRKQALHKAMGTPALKGDGKVEWKGEMFNVIVEENK